MSHTHPPPISRQDLLEYFLRASTPRAEWQVGMEVEKLGRAVGDGRPLAYDSTGPSVRRVLEFLHERRGGDPVIEADNLIGLNGPWGGISLEPGGQVEWSSRPQDTLDDLEATLESHLSLMREAGQALGVEWLQLGLDPVHAVSDMPWMPKGRYKIMRPYLGKRGRLAHRMMTQTASIQCAFDYADREDWTDKFRAAALMTPLAVALFANSSAMDGEESGYRCYRQIIWSETDPDRCGLPRVVFEPGFGVEAWLDWLLEVPTIFRHRPQGWMPAGGVPFGNLLRRVGCDAIKNEDWETHISTIFTEVRSYGYIEVRSADLQPDSGIFSVPAFWTGILYHEGSLEAALELGSPFDEYGAWNEAVRSAARFGLDRTAAGRKIRDRAEEALSLSAAGLAAGAACAGSGRSALDALGGLASRHGLRLRA